MIKGLEALDRIEKNTFPYTSALYEQEDLKEDRNIIRTDLKELESIKTVKHTEALENLAKIIDYYNETAPGVYGLGEVVVNNEFAIMFEKELKNIKQALMKAKNQEEVIKECIKLLSIDGVNTKAKVKDKLKGLLK